MESEKTISPYYICDSWSLVRCGSSIFEIPNMPDTAVRIMGPNNWYILESGKVVRVVTSLQYKHFIEGKDNMTNKEMEILILALLRLIEPEDRKRLQYTLDTFNYGSSCGDNSYDRKEAYARMQSIEKLKAIVATPVEDLL